MTSGFLHPRLAHGGQSRPLDGPASNFEPEVSHTPAYCPLIRRPHDGSCDPAEHDVVQGARGVDPGLARYRRSLSVRSDSIRPTVILLVKNAPHYTETVEHLLAEMNLTQ